MATETESATATPAPSIDPRRFAIASAIVATAAATIVFGPILYHMVLHWKSVDDYSHGFLVAPLAIYFAWEQRRKLRKAVIDPSWWGVVPLALGALSLAIGRLGVELMSMRTAYVLTLHGVVLLLLGKRIYQILAFPLAFMFMMVPLPQSLVNVIAFPLQLFAADLAVTVLQFFGLPLLREGNIIHLPEFQLFVAEACSGLRSLMALGTLGVVFAYFYHRSWTERAILVISTLPIAVLVNSFRVGLTAMLTFRWGAAAAQGVVHQTEGFFTFGLAFCLLLFEASLLTRFWPKGRKTVEAAK